MHANVVFETLTLGTQDDGSRFIAENVAAADDKHRRPLVLDARSCPASANERNHGIPRAYVDHHVGSVGSGSIAARRHDRAHAARERRAPPLQRHAAEGS